MISRRLLQDRGVVEYSSRPRRRIEKKQDPVNLLVKNYANKWRTLYADKNLVNRKSLNIWHKKQIHKT